MTSGSRVLVTGCAGFIGSATARRLLDLGCEVRGVDRLSDYYDVRIKERNLRSLTKYKGFSFHLEDLSQTNIPALLEGVEYVVHLAAQAGVRASWGTSFQTYLSDNVLATQRLLESARLQPQLRKFVYASSSSVYGLVDEFPMRESATPRPVSPYGVTKLAGENLAMLYNHNCGIPTICLRYFTVYGPGQRPDMAIHKFIRSALAGTPIEIYGDIGQTRDFTYVDDVVEANVRALDCNDTSIVCNIGGGHRILLGELVDLIGQCTGRPLEWRLVERQAGDVHDTASDCTLAGQMLGFSPQMNIADGIKHEVEWVRQLEREGI